MAYFYKNYDNNFEYSYLGVNDCILGEYVTPDLIEAYIEDETFYEAVKNSYKHIDLSGRSKHDKERFAAKTNKTANWLRRKANAIYF